MDLIKEAKKRGYRKGTIIIYPQPGGGKATDSVEGNYFEVKDGKVLAYGYPKHERTYFERMRFDTLFNGEVWAEIVK